MKLIQILLTIVVVASIGHVIYSNRSNLSFVWKVGSRFRVKMLVESLLLLSFSVVSYLGLSYLSPVLNWGWMNLIYGSSGHMLTTPLLALSSGGSIWFQIAATIAVLCLMGALPYLARIEEELFRGGNLRIKNVLKQSLAFGFVHLFAGVPIAVAITLSFVGLFWAWKYVSAFHKASEHLNIPGANEEALMESTAYHTLYNTICITVLLLLIWTVI